MTGATGGIGKAIIRAYARPEVEFLLLGRDPVQMAAIVLSARENGAAVTQHVLDVREHDRFEFVLNEFQHEGPIDLAILAAGVKSGNNCGKEAPGQAKRVIDVNLQAVVFQVETLVGPMVERGRGQIALFSSIAALDPQSDLLSYSATKAAIRAYAAALRRAIQGSGVTVHVITPGFVDTPMTQRHRGRAPFLISAEAAASKIKRGLDRGEKYISFPFSLLILARINSFLPPALSDRLSLLFRAEIKPDKDEIAEDTPKTG